jgi:putative flippase GtrA
MRQFVRFLLCGGLAAGLNWASRFLFSMWMPFEYAVVTAFFMGLSSGYVLMRLYVFETKEAPVLLQISKYVAINMLALVQTLLISVVLLRWLLPAVGISNHADALAHFVGVLTPVVTSYFGHKLITFR